MGLSSKQVPGDHELDWSQTLFQSRTPEFPKPPPVRRQQQQQPQSEPLKCPRCDSTNTKFCYYNNYNRSQPRHFCKACKRHWTKGGTLRNVPVGGGRKNKRIKRSKGGNTTTAAAAATSSATTTTTKRTNPHVGIQNMSDARYQALILPPSPRQDDEYSTINSFTRRNFMGNNGTLQVPPNQTLQFSFSNLGCFDTNPSSIPTSLQSSNGYKYTRMVEEDSTIGASMPNASSIDVSQTWQVPTTSGVIDIPNYWNWNDMETMVSADLNIPWDDTEIKP